MTLPEKRKYFNSPSVYRGSTPKGGGSLRNDFLDCPFINLLRCVCVYLFFCFVCYLYRVEDCLPWYGELIH